MGPDEQAPGWAAVGWLTSLALGSTVLGWVLVGRTLHRLPSHVGATLLLLQPILSLILGMIVLSERPSPVQLLGCWLIVVVIAYVGRDGC